MGENLQQTLVVLKPDTIGRSIIGEIISRFERAGLHMIGMKMVQPDEDFMYHHYETISKLISRRGKEVFDVNQKFMMQTPLIAMVMEGVDAVEYVRKIVGSTEPKSAAPGTIRGDFAHMSYDYCNSKNIGLPNLIHASGDVDEAKQEIEHWFDNSELFSYNKANHAYTR